LDVEQALAMGTGDQALIYPKRGSARWIDALLKGDFGGGHGCNG
jgi:hypothetical protein